MQIKFYDKMEDSLLKFAVIIAKMESMYFASTESAVHMRFRAGTEKMANLYWMPQELTYPLIQPKLIDEAKRRGFIG
jgi:hypothetical protein